MAAVWKGSHSNSKKSIYFQIHCWKQVGGLIRGEFSATGLRCYLMTLLFFVRKPVLVCTFQIIYVNEHRDSCRGGSTGLLTGLKTSQTFWLNFVVFQCSTFWWGNGTWKCFSSRKQFIVLAWRFCTLVFKGQIKCNGASVCLQVWLLGLPYMVT